jgi:hypothetical protein
MTHVFPFYGDIHQCWDVFYSEYHRLSEVLGRSPFEFETPKHSTIHEYVPKDGDEIIINFWDTDHKQALLVVEAEIVPDEDRQYNIFVHPQGGNSFEEPLKTALSIWKEVKNALKKAEKQRVIKTSKRKKKRKPQIITLNALEDLRAIYFKALNNNITILPREDAAKKVGIAINTWREHDLELWNRWEDKRY